MNPNYSKWIQTGQNNPKRAQNMKQIIRLSYHVLIENVENIEKHMGELKHAEKQLQISRLYVPYMEMKYLPYIQDIVPHSHDSGGSIFRSIVRVPCFNFDVKLFQDHMYMYIIAR